MKYNTIILLKGELTLTDREHKSYQRGDSICGIDRSPEEIQRWSADEEETAYAALSAVRCSYNHGNLWNITEYALEWCNTDEDGDFVEGSDYKFAEEE